MWADILPLVQLKVLLQERKVLDFSGQKKDLVNRLLSSHGEASPQGTPEGAPSAPAAKRTRGVKAADSA